MSRRWFSVSLALGTLILIAGAIALGVGLGGREEPRKFNVIFLTAESFRADFIRPDITPNLLGASEVGLHFTGHRAVSAWTAPNINAILTGASSFDQGVHAQRQSIPADWAVPLKTLGGKGWTVVGLQPFMQVDAFRNLGISVQPGRDVMDWLREEARNSEPFVLWHHYLETHLPYAPSDRFRPDWESLLPPDDTDARQRIDAVMTHAVIPADSIAFKPSDAAAISALHGGSYREFDAWFGEFWEFFERSGLRQNTILVVTSDHGDEHLERGHVGHASTTHEGHLYEELIRVPLFIWVPPALGDGPVGVVDRVTDHLDIMPTVMRWLGVRAEMPLAGNDLLKQGSEQVWIAVTSKAGFQEPNPEDIRSFKAARLEGRWKLHLSFEQDRIIERRLYDLATDPGEQRDRASEHPDIVARLEAPLSAAFRARRIAGTLPPGAKRAIPAPGWVTPSAGGAVSFDAVADGFRMEWTGSPTAGYIIQYQAGQGPLSIRGEMDVIGTAKEFGPVDRGYWDRFIVPYKTIRLRVGLAGSDDHWSNWLVLTPQP